MREKGSQVSSPFAGRGLEGDERYNKQIDHDIGCTRGGCDTPTCGIRKLWLLS